MAIISDCIFQIDFRTLKIIKKQYHLLSYQYNFPVTILLVSCIGHNASNGTEQNTQHHSIVLKMDMVQHNQSWIGDDHNESQ